MVTEALQFHSQPFNRRAGGQFILSCLPMLFWIDLADRLGVDVPLMKAMVKVVSTIMGRDYAAEAP